MLERCHQIVPNVPIFRRVKERRELKTAPWSPSARHGGSVMGLPQQAPGPKQRGKGAWGGGSRDFNFLFYFFLRDEAPLSPPHPHGQKMRPTDRAGDNGRLPWKCAFSLAVSTATERHTILFL